MNGSIAKFKGVLRLTGPDIRLLYQTFDGTRHQPASGKGLEDGIVPSIRVLGILLRSLVLEERHGFLTVNGHDRRNAMRIVSEKRSII